MSWETLVVSTLEIAPGVPEETKATIVEDFEGVLETDLIWDDQHKEYKVSHINWSSHVREEEIKKCHQKHKRHIKRISLSLWHLSEADFNLNLDRSEHEQVFGRWYKQRPGTIKESAAYLFDTLLPPTRVAAGV
ncbi:MAG: hypothetical protein KKD46_07640 [Euryarchaeota archaeon]|nr:hypothetical protein [Euryarchaeota archaeon]MBU4340771.1 hypothetical protein [Euryarchaeota archaeon]MCG2737180.1 hypothetical protein [Candidatus Methanoperedenaceae archaeon]